MRDLSRTTSESHDKLTFSTEYVPPMNVTSNQWFQIKKLLTGNVNTALDDNLYKLYFKQITERKHYMAQCYTRVPLYLFVKHLIKCFNINLLFIFH